MLPSLRRSRWAERPGIEQARGAPAKKAASLSYSPMWDKVSDGCSGKLRNSILRFWLRDSFMIGLRSATPVRIEDTLLPFDLPSVARKKVTWRLTADCCRRMAGYFF